MKNINFVMNFQDPSTIFSYHLIAVHHEVFWYIIIILSLVYWAMYVIIRDFTWNNFNRSIGFFRFLRGFSWIIAFLGFLSFFWLIINFILRAIISGIVYSLDRLHGIDVEMNKYMFIKGDFCYDILEDDLVDNSNDYITFIVRGHFVFPWFVTKLSFKDYVRSFFSYTFNSLIIDLDPKGYSEYIRDEWYAGEDDFLLVEGFRHSTILEYVYAAFPTIIIVYILVPSLFLLYSLDEDLDPKLTIKVIGHQWYWNYEYEISVNAFDGKFHSYQRSFDSVLIQEDDLKFGNKRLLEVDKRLVLPINVTLRILITSTDVLHSWSVPEMGIKMDAVPGRLNQFITLINRPGIFYGQCSELCGVAHGFMPIVIHAIPYEIFLAHLGEHKVPEFISELIKVINNSPELFFFSENVLREVFAKNYKIYCNIDNFKVQNVGNSKVYNFENYFQNVDNSKAFNLATYLKNLDVNRIYDFELKYKIFSDLEQKPKITSDLEQKPKITSDLEQKPKITSDLEQKYKITSDLEQKPKITSDLEQKPKITSDLEQKPKITSDLEQKPKIISDFEQKHKIIDDEFIFQKFFKK